MNVSLRVLLVISSYLPNVGGLQSVTSSLARDLRRRGNRVAILTNRYPRALPASEEIEEIRVTRWLFLVPRLSHLRNKRLDLFLAALFYFPVTLVRLLWLIARQKPEVVNLHFVGTPAPFLLIARALWSFRLIVSLHGDDVEGLSRGTRLDRWIFRKTLQCADAMTACSHYLLERARAIEPSIALKSYAIPNGIDFPIAADSELSSDFILGIGRFVPKKGFDVLLHAVAQCESVATPARLILIGDGPERNTLESLKSELGLNGRVDFLGAQSHSSAMRSIATSRLVAIPSREEPFGMVALEAMAAGKPIVATRVGGLVEILDGADAILVEPNNPEVLADAIQNALARLEREPRFGARNRAIAARFSAERMTDEYIALYTNPYG